MKKKTIVISVVSLISLSLLGTATWASQTDNPWARFEKRNGVIQANDGVLVEVPDEKAKSAVVKSIDPVTGQPTIKLDDFMDKKALKQTLQTEIKNREERFQFNVLYQDKKPILFSNHHILTPIPNSNYTILEASDNLYLVDIYNSNIKPLLSDHIGQYDINELSSTYVEDHVPTWGTNASVSPDGRQVVFHSSRNVIHDNNLNGQMWVKDLKSGREEAIADGGYAVIGWGAKDEIYVRRADAIEKINVTTKESRPVIDFALDSAISYPYMIYQKEYGKLVISNLETSEESELSFETLNRVGPIKTINGSPWALLFNAPDSSKPERTLVLINMLTHEHKQLSEPEDTFFQGGQWVNENQFVINVRHKDSEVEESYIINLNEVE